MYNAQTMQCCSIVIFLLFLVSLFLGSRVLLKASKLYMQLKIYFDDNNKKKFDLMSERNRLDRQIFELTNESECGVAWTVFVGTLFFWSCLTRLIYLRTRSLFIVGLTNTTKYNNNNNFNEITQKFRTNTNGSENTQSSIEAINIDCSARTCFVWVNERVSVANLRSLVIELNILIVCGFVAFYVCLHPSPGHVRCFCVLDIRFVCLDSIQDKKESTTQFVCRILSYCTAHSTEPLNASGECNSSHCEHAEPFFGYFVWISSI